MTYPVGTIIPAGVVLPQTVQITPAPALNPAFFTAGFSNYDINGGLGVVVASNTVVAPRCRSIGSRRTAMPQLPAAIRRRL